MKSNNQKKFIVTQVGDEKPTVTHYDSPQEVTDEDLIADGRTCLTVDGGLCPCQKEQFISAIRNK